MDLRDRRALSLTPLGEEELMAPDNTSVNQWLNGHLNEFI